MRSPLRGIARRMARTAMHRRVTLPSDEHLARSACVIAPHPDDETLGCGGTILRKLEQGANVHIIFVSDGASSHAPAIASREMGRTRRAEGHEAAKRLGIPTEHVHHLGLPDGDLAHNLEAGKSAIRDILHSARFEEIYAPHRHEPPEDHRAAFEMALTAMRAHDSSVTLFEYPVWLWDAWPWVPSRKSGLRPALRFARRGVTAWKSLANELRHGVKVASVLDAKRRALEAHHSQMQAPQGEPDWATLGSVGGGDFLDCFFQPYELFRRSAPGDSSPS